MGSLITLLIGHRGVGKTTLLKTFKERYPRWQAFDLDTEVANSTGETVEAMLARSEPEFRNHERRVLNELVSGATGPAVIAVGAGFEGPVPANTHVIWIRRVTDSAGRVLSNRPRLNTSVSRFDEYMERYPVRDKRFHFWAQEELTVPEGGAAELADFLEPRSSWKIAGDLTLLPENFRDWEHFWNKRANWGLRKIEIRDDLLMPDKAGLALKSIPAAQVLWSCRTDAAPPPDHDIDWPLEMGLPPRPAHVLSLHERAKDLETILRTFTEIPAVIHKLAIEIRDFHELRRAHQWWLEDPKRRAFLPRSPNGRWRWYRSLFGPRMPLHYIREGEGTQLDQPFLWQALLQPQLGKNFAAVLGSPVDHSLSPMEHRSYFAQQGMPFVSIEVQDTEFTEALEVLRELGLSHAAVTAPLKRVASAACREFSSTASALRSVNTMIFTGEHWLGHNTDVLALETLRRELPAAQTVWLWGGGGIKSSVKRVWPEAREIPARQGTWIDESPDLLIWATGRSREFQWPPEHARPQMVLDLNYGEDSPGLEWAIEHNLSYQSGFRMFKLQAEAQRLFWSGQKDV